MIERIQTTLADVFHIPVVDITEATTPDTVPHWDSVTHMYVVFALEDEFHVDFTEDQMIRMMDGFPAIIAVVTEALAQHV